MELLIDAFIKIMMACLIATVVLSNILLVVEIVNRTKKQ